MYICVGLRVLLVVAHTSRRHAHTCVPADGIVNTHSDSLHGRGVGCALLEPERGYNKETRTHGRPTPNTCTHYSIFGTLSGWNFRMKKAKHRSIDVPLKTDSLEACKCAYFSQLLAVFAQICTVYLPLIDSIDPNCRLLFSLTKPSISESRLCGHTDR